MRSPENLRPSSSATAPSNSAVTTATGSKSSNPTQEWPSADDFNLDSMFASAEASGTTGDEEEGGLDVCVDLIYIYTFLNFRFIYVLDLL